MAEIPWVGVAEGVPVPGVGQLFWAAEVTAYGECVYATPQESGCEVVLWFDWPHRTEGFESMQFAHYRDGAEVLHAVYDGAGNELVGDEKMRASRFPAWFVRSLVDLQTWTGAEGVDCVHDVLRGGAAPVRIAVVNPHPTEEAMLGNPDVFLQNLASRMTLYASATEPTAA